MKKQVVVHPLLFSLYPIVLLYSVNYDFFEFSIVFKPALLSALLAVCTWWAASLVFSDRKRAAIFVSALLLGMYSFGAFREYLVRGGEGTQVGNKIALGVFAVALLAVGFCLKLKRYTEQWTYLMNFMGTVLCCLPLVNAAMMSYRTLQARELLPDRQAFEAESPITAPADAPDIYYLVLDGYGRADFLQEEFDFDNSDLVSFLEERGFVIAQKSRANYPMTLVSLASTLNFTYLDAVVGNQMKDQPDRRFIRDLVRHSRTVKLLRKAGYSIVNVASEYYEAEIDGADVDIREWWHLNIFESTIFSMTPFPWALTKLGWPILYDLHRDRILYAFRELSEMPGRPGPKFVYAHIFVGHPPFVFGPNGEKVNRATAYSWDEGEKFMAARGASRQEYMRGYGNQLRYLNEKLKVVVDGIRAGSSPPPVIIIQGDHGPGSRLSLYSLEGTDVRERFSILNAYHLPGVEEEVLYDSISPVNTFRVVFNHYFGTNYPLLADESFYTPFLRPYDFVPVGPEELVAGSDEAGTSP